MSILITGVTGFIGTRLLQAVSAEVGAQKVIALSSRTNDLCESVVYNPQDYSISNADAGKLEDVEVIIHAGAYTPKTQSEADSIDGSTGNIRFTAALIGLPLPSLRKVIFLSTVDVYGPGDFLNESSPTLPDTLYGMSKLYCERMISVFTERRGIAHQVLRVGHVYGPGEGAYQKIIPRCIARLIAGEDVELWGDGSESRSFIYVDDVVAAVLGSIDLDSDVGVINIVGGRPVTIRELVDDLLEIGGNRARVVLRERSVAPHNLVFDNSKLRSTLLPEETDLLVGLRAEYEYAAARP